MSCIKELPDGYVEIKRLNLQDDKKTMLIVNVLAVVLYIVLFVIAFIIKPFDMDLIEIDLIISLLTCVAMIVYMVLHELTHGIVMKHYGGQKVKYGFTGLYAYAGSSEITAELIHDMVHHESGVTAYNLANAVASGNRRAAFDAIGEIMADKDNRGAVLGAITTTFLDMYRVQCARQSRVSSETVKQDFAYYARGFAIDKLYRSGGMSTEKLRKCIKILRDTNIKLNSSNGNEKIILEQMVTKMLTS